jgi:copper chaperone
MKDEAVLKIAIEGMHCGGCVRRVTAALSRLEGVEIRAVDVGEAEVGYDAASVEPQEILDAVSGIGFPARAA